MRDAPCCDMRDDLENGCKPLESQRLAASGDVVPYLVGMELPNSVDVISRLAGAIRGFPQNDASMPMSWRR